MAPNPVVRISPVLPAVLSHPPPTLQSPVPMATNPVVPISPIQLPYMIAQGHIRYNKRATTAQIALHAPGVSRMIELFNQNIGSILKSSEPCNFDEVTAGELPSKAYGVTRLLRMLSKLHEWIIPSVLRVWMNF
ncbi:unnamed protein product [Caenorhabditis nigoni]